MAAILSRGRWVKTDIPTAIPVVMGSNKVPGATVLGEFKCINNNSTANSRHWLWSKRTKHYEKEKNRVHRGGWEFNGGNWIKRAKHGHLSIGWSALSPLGRNRTKVSPVGAKIGPMSFHYLFFSLQTALNCFFIFIMYILCKCYSVYVIPVIVYYVVYVTWKPTIKLL